MCCLVLAKKLIYVSTWILIHQWLRRCCSIYACRHGDRAGGGNEIALVEEKTEVPAMYKRVSMFLMLESLVIGTSTSKIRRSLTPPQS